MFALILACLGIYAVVAYSVHQRSGEFGVRLAIGASGGELKKQVLFETLRLAFVGIGIGAAASWLLAHGLGALLFGITATDPATFLGMVGILGFIALRAGYFPARRASRIDPAITLRSI